MLVAKASTVDQSVSSGILSSKPYRAGVSHTMARLEMLRIIKHICPSEAVKRSFSYRTTLLGLTGSVSGIKKTEPSLTRRLAVVNGFCIWLTVPIPVSILFYFAGPIHNVVKRYLHFIWATYLHCSGTRTRDRE